MSSTEGRAQRNSDRRASDSATALSDWIVSVQDRLRGLSFQAHASVNVEGRVLFWVRLEGSWCLAVHGEKVDGPLQALERASLPQKIRSARLIPALLDEIDSLRREMTAQAEEIVSELSGAVDSRIEQLVRGQS